MSATQQRSERRKELAARGNEMEQIEIKHLDGRVLYTHQMACQSGMSMRHALESASKSGADLRGADLSDAVLRGADLTGADLTGAVLRYADLSGAVLRGAVLSGANMTGAVLRGAVLGGADLTGADLRDADLRGAVLRDADLTGAYLRGAVLRYADMTGAVLRDAVLSGADMTGAVLRDADMTGAVLRGATIYGVKITRQPVEIGGLRWGVLIIDGHIKIGCQLHSIDAWSAFDDAAIAAMDGRHALRFWRDHKAAIMSLAAPFATPAAADEVAA